MLKNKEVKQAPKPSTRPIKNRKLGYHFNSKYWQDYKKKIPPLPEKVHSILIGMILGDAGIRKVGYEAHVKFEQGKKQKLFLFDLFSLLSTYCFMEQPGVRFERNTTRIKSYWFKTFSHPCFTQIYNLFYDHNVTYKKLKPNLIKNHLDGVALAYWIMSDGALQRNRKEWIIHSQGFTYAENLRASTELNDKFNLKTSVISHKKKYFVIKTDKDDSDKILSLIRKHFCLSMEYKLAKEQRKLIST